MANFSKSKRQKFAEEYVKTGEGAAAASVVAPDSKKPRDVGYRLKRDPNVKEAIALAKTDLDIGPIKYNLEKAMLEAEESMKFARATKNANALVKAVELRAKLSGLLDESLKLPQGTGFLVQIVGLRDPVQLPPSIETKTVEALPVPEIPFVDEEDPWA